MKVPLLDLKAQLSYLGNEIKEEVIKVIDSTSYILGPKVEELEKKIAEYCGVPYCTGVSSGTDALLIALMALDIKAGDIVITSPYSFFATAGAIARLGAVPVFVDIDSGTYNIDPAKLSEWFAANSDKICKVKAVVPVHLYGQCADMDPILEITDKYQIPVIEDAAQAIGSTYPSNNGIRKAGSMGAMGCFSFFPSKNLGAAGDGGMVCTKDEALAQKLKLLRTHGAKPKYYHSIIGGNFRLDPVQAAILLVKLPYLEKWHQQRRENAHYYDEAFTNSPVKLPAIAYKRENHIYNQYVLKVPEKRDELRQYLRENEIGNEVYYPVPFHVQKCFEYLNYKKGDFPESESSADNTVAIPVYPELTNEMQDFVIEKIKKFYE